MDFEQIKFLVETITSPQVIFVIVIVAILKFKPQILERIATLDVAGVKLELRELKSTVIQTQEEIQEFSSKLDAMADQYIETAENFDPLSTAKDIDKVGSQLKSYAASLDNIDFVFDHLSEDADHSLVYAAGCAIQVRPQPKFLDPLVKYIGAVSKSNSLKELRLRVAFKLVQAVENILRSDNKKPEKLLSQEERARASEVLRALRNHKRSQDDHAANGAKSIVTRIDRTLKLA